MCCARRCLGLPDSLGARTPEAIASLRSCVTYFGDKAEFADSWATVIRQVLATAVLPPTTPSPESPGTSPPATGAAGVSPELVAAVFKLVHEALRRNSGMLLVADPATGQSALRMAISLAASMFTADAADSRAVNGAASLLYDVATGHGACAVNALPQRRCPPPSGISDPLVGFLSCRLSRRVVWCGQVARLVRSADGVLSCHSGSHLPWLVDGCEPHHECAGVRTAAPELTALACVLHGSVMPCTSWVGGWQHHAFHCGPAVAASAVESSVASTVLPASLDAGSRSTILMALRNLTTSAPYVFRRYVGSWPDCCLCPDTSCIRCRLGAVSSGIGDLRHVCRGAMPASKMSGAAPRATAARHASAAASESADVDIM